MAAQEVTKITDIYSEFLFDIQLDINQDFFSDHFLNKTIKSIIDDTARNLMSRVDFKAYFLTHTISFKDLNTDADNDPSTNPNPNIAAILANEPMQINGGNFLRLQNVDYPVVYVFDIPSVGRAFNYCMDAKDMSIDLIHAMTLPYREPVATAIWNFLRFSNILFKIEGDSIRIWTNLNPSGATLPGLFQTTLANTFFDVFIVTKNWIHTDVYPGSGFTSVLDAAIVSDNIDTLITAIPKDLLIGGAKWRWLKKRGQEYESYFNEHEQLIQDYYKLGYGGAIQ